MNFSLSSPEGLLNHEISIADLDLLQLLRQFLFLLLSLLQLLNSLSQL